MASPEKGTNSPPVRKQRGSRQPVRPGCGCGSVRGTTFIGDYFGIDSTGTSMVTTSVSTYDYAGENPSHYQQQIVAKVPMPIP